MVYFTPDFEEEFEKPESIIRSYIAYANDVFIKSQIDNVKLKLHCISRLDIMDSPGLKYTENIVFHTV